MRLPRFRARLFLAFCVLSLSSCMSFSAVDPDLKLLPHPDTRPRWLLLGKGLWYAEGSADALPLEWYALKADLKSPGLEIVALPGPAAPPQLEAAARRVPDVLRSEKLRAAVNATPFDPRPADEGDPLEIVGLHIAEGMMLSPPETRFDAIVFYKDGSASVLSPPLDLADVKCGFGGFHIILKNGLNLGGQTVRAPRTAFGLSGDGRFLFVLVADGRRRGSIGLTTWELSEWLRRLGAEDGINMDGGSSSSLAIRDESGRAVLVNRPRTGWGIPLVPLTANQLGIRIHD